MLQALKTLAAVLQGAQVIYDIYKAWRKASNKEK